MNDLIRKLREASLAVEKWPESMKKLHALRLAADTHFRQPCVMSLPAGWTYRIPRIDEGGWPTRDAAGEDNL